MKKSKLIGRPPKKKSEVKKQKTIRVSDSDAAKIKALGHTAQSFFDLHLRSYE